MAAAPEESRVFLAVLPGSRGSFPAGTGRHRRFPPALLTDRGCHLPFPAGMSTLPVSVSSGGWGSGPRGPAVRPACREPHPWAAPARRQRPSHRHRCSPRHGRAHRRSAVGPGRRPPAPSRPRPGGTGSVRRCLPGPADPRRAAPAVPGGVPGHPPRSHRDSQCGRPGAIPAPPRPAPPPGGGCARGLGAGPEGWAGRRAVIPVRRGRGFLRGRGWGGAPRGFARPCGAAAAPLGESAPWRAGGGTARPLGGHGFESSPRLHGAPHSSRLLPAPSQRFPGAQPCSLGAPPCAEQEVCGCRAPRRLLQGGGLSSPRPRLLQGTAER